MDSTEQLSSLVAHTMFLTNIQTQLNELSDQIEEIVKKQSQECERGQGDYDILFATFSGTFCNFYESFSFNPKETLFKRSI